MLRSGWLWSAVIYVVLISACGEDKKDSSNESLDGGSDAGEGGDGTSGDMCDVPALFERRCGSGDCHGGTMRINFTDPGVERRVTLVRGKECSGFLANPASPETSLLYKQVAGTPDCGEQMPRGGPPLTSAEVECIREWISGLVPDIGGDGDGDGDAPDGGLPDGGGPVIEHCKPGKERACFSGPEALVGVGICKAGTQECGEDELWGPCEDEEVGTFEDCSTAEVDENCDGKMPGCDDLWARAFGEIRNDDEEPTADQEVNGVAVDDENNVYIVGSTEGVSNWGLGPLVSEGNTTALKTNVVLAKFDRYGNPLWVKNFGDSSNQMGEGIAVSPLDDSVVIVGRYRGNIDFGSGTPHGVLGEDEMFVAKFTTDGDYVWSRAIRGYGSSRSEDVAIDPTNGSVWVVGSFDVAVDFDLTGSAVSAGGDDIFLIKLSSATGGQTFATSFGGAGHDYARGVAVDSAGNVAITGYFGGLTDPDGEPGDIDFGGDTLTSQGENDIFVAQFSKSGVHQWSVAFGGEGEDRPDDIAVDGDDNLALVGWFEGDLAVGEETLTSAGGYDMFFVRMSSTNEVLLTRSYGDAMDNISRTSYGESARSAVTADSAGNLYLSGPIIGSMTFDGLKLTATIPSNPASARTSDSLIVSLEPDGTRRWAARFGRSGTEMAQDVAVDDEGYILLAGRSKGTTGEFSSSGAVTFQGGYFDGYLTRLEIPSDE